jgi:dTDP-glucose pyrophosphorylase
MGTIALVMAGGHGERMRASGRSTPKPLVRVRGVPLLERNLYALLRAGLEEIVVSVPADVPAIGAFVEGRGAAIATAAGARLETLVEDRPLGNIGCAGSFRDRTDEVLVVYADNLTTLDLGTVLAHHRAADVALTLATHVETFRTPYGELSAEDGLVVDYREKPEHHVLVSSAISVLGPPALEAAAGGAPIGLSDLFHAVRRQGDRVADVRHDAAWADVNDAEALARAEAMVAADPGAFDLWREPPPRAVDLALVVAWAGVVAAVGAGGRWTLPGAASVGGVSDAEPRPLAEFDDLDDGRGEITRFRIVRVDAEADVPLPEGMRWCPHDELARESDPASLASPLMRAWAAAALSHGGEVIDRP